MRVDGKGNPSIKEVTVHRSKMDKMPDKEIPDMSQMDFDDRLRVLLGVPPSGEEQEEKPEKAPSLSTQSDPEK